MISWKKSLFAVASFAVAALPRLAAEKLNLDRITPVPATEQIPLLDFFRAPLFMSPQINSAGTHIAALVTGAVDKQRLLIYDVKTQKVDILQGIGDKDLYAFSWLSDKRLAYFVSSEKLYGLAMMAVEVGRLDENYPLIQYCGARLLWVPPDNRDSAIVWLTYDALDTKRDLGVSVVNTKLQRGRFTDLTAASASHDDLVDARDNNDRHIIKRYPAPNAEFSVGYLTDKTGHLEFAVTADAGVPSLHRLEENQWIKCPVNLEAVDILCPGNEPGELFVLAPREPGKPQAIRAMEGATGTMGGVVFQDNAYDFRGWAYRDPATHDVVGLNFERSGPKTVWFDESYRNLQKLLDGFFPGLVVRIIGSDEARKTFLVSTFSDRQPPVYNSVNLEQHSVALIKNSAPWVDPKRMQPMNVMKFKTKDGMTLDAYLTLPAGATKDHPVPMIVLPHGGPWVRDSWHFNGEVQFLANRGYAVLQPNYRGSTGYDWMFPEEDQYDFLKMHEDVTAATKTALATGFIDSGRVAIMGGSFGAYLALSGVVHEPSLYRCAVTIAGVFDWKRLMAQLKAEQYEKPFYARLLKKLGDPKRDTSKFDAISPVRHVDQIRVPVFVSHGKEDPVAGIEQSKELVSALEKYNVPHEVFFVSGEGHGMAHLTNQVDLYTRIEAFLAKNLAPAKPATITAGTP